MSFSLAEHFVGIYEDIHDNLTNETSVFAEEGGRKTSTATVKYTNCHVNSTHLVTLGLFSKHFTWAGQLCCWVIFFDTLFEHARLCVLKTAM